MRYLVVLALGFFVACALQLSEADAAPLTIHAATAYDKGSLAESGSTVDIDTVRSKCGTAPNFTAEPFYNSLLGVKLTNSSNATVNVLDFTFDIRSLGIAKRIKSIKLAPTLKGTIKSGETVETAFLFLRAKDGMKYVTTKSGLLNIPDGFAQITLTLHARASTGHRYTLTKRFALSFGDQNRC